MMNTVFELLKYGLFIFPLTTLCILSFQMFHNLICTSKYIYFLATDVTKVEAIMTLCTCI